MRALEARYLLGALLVASCVLPSLDANRPINESPLAGTDNGNAGVAANSPGGSVNAGSPGNGGSSSGMGTQNPTMVGGGEAGDTTQGGDGSGIPGPGGSGSGEGGMGGAGDSGPVATGHFKMLVYYEAQGYKHASIASGITMLQELGAANDFEVVVSDGEQTEVGGDEGLITEDGLSQFDIVFFMNTSGDIFSNEQQQIFIDHLHEKPAFAGMHAATDTEQSWPWYEELVGEIYYDHSLGTVSGTLALEAGQLTHPALVGLPNPWTRDDEWFHFPDRIGTALPGLKILLRYSAGTGAPLGQPVSWVREWEGIRSFYTAMGHNGSAFAEPDLRKHVLGGVLWAVRRLQP